MCARVRFCFWKASAYDFFFEKLYGMRARALAVHACPRARGRPRRLLLSATRRQRRKVDKCRVADKKQTNKPTNTHYSFIGILADHAEPCSATVPSQHWAAEKQTWKLSPSFSPLPTHVTSARKQASSPDIMVGRAACACALHPFLLCLEHDNGWVRWHTLLIPTNTSK